MDRPALADFLRRTREALQPADVGIAPGPRRRTPGLRRDDVATLAGISTDYYTRLEQARGPHPSPQVLTSLARALRLRDDERDHLFHLAGKEPPRRPGGSQHVRPGLLHLLEALDSAPASVIDDLGRVLVQNRMARALLGDANRFTGRDRSMYWRWFAGDTRASVPAEDHEHHSRVQVADLRATWARRRGDADVEDLVGALQQHSAEFRELWDRHEVGVRRRDSKRFVHPLVGTVEVDCEILVVENGGGQYLLLLTPRAGTSARDQLDLLRVVGDQDLAGPRSPAAVSAPDASYGGHPTHAVTGALEADGFYVPPASGGS